eukprot:3374070-Rhodomonas_salina.4
MPRWRGREEGRRRKEREGRQGWVKRERGSEGPGVMMWYLWSGGRVCVSSQQSKTLARCV